jgi:cardiolipin synthase
LHKGVFYTLLGGICTGYIWLFFAATSPTLPRADHPLLFYSNQTRQDIKLTFCSALNAAQRSLFIMMYGITDPEVIRILSKKASQGVRTKIHYDKKASANLTKQLPFPVEASAFASKGLMHRKILIIDDAIVFLGSANFTTASLKHHDNLVIGLYSPRLACLLQQEDQQSICFEIAGKPAELWLLPDDKTAAALNHLLDSLRQAQTSIQIAMFTLTHPLIAEALIEAKRRGVLVEVAVDYYTAQGASKKTVRVLEEAGIHVMFSRGQELLHHKWALIDHRKLITGSANWTKAAFAKNEDFLLFLPELADGHQKFLRTLWENISDESFESTGS